MAKKGYVWLLISVISFFFMSASFLMMPFDFAEIGLPWMDFVPGGVFWFFMLMGTVAQVILTATRRKTAGRKRRVGRRTVGVFSFFRNTPAILADVTCAISLLALVAAFMLTEQSGYSCYVCLTVFLFSFCMHCILNGKNYYFLNHQVSNLKISESKLPSDTEKE